MACCPKCEREYAEGVNFCPWCGHALAGASMEVPAEALAAAASMEDGPQSASDSLPWAQPAEPDTEANTENSVAAESPRSRGPGRTACARFPSDAVLPPPIHETTRGTPAPLAPEPDSAPRLLQPKLVVIRGQNLDRSYPIYEGRNTIGRFADRPVDIDLVGQEAEGQVWSSRLHAAVISGCGELRVEDLNSLNGTWLNGVRIHPGQQRELKPGDVLQIGMIQLRVAIE